MNTKNAGNVGGGPSLYVKYVAMAVMVFPFMVDGVIEPAGLGLPPVKNPIPVYWGEDAGGSLNDAATSVCVVFCIYAPGEVVITLPTIVTNSGVAGTPGAPGVVLTNNPNPAPEFVTS